LANREDTLAWNETAPASASYQDPKRVQIADYISNMDGNWLVSSEFYINYMKQILG